MGFLGHLLCEISACLRASLETSRLLCAASAYLCVSTVRGFRNRFYPDIGSQAEPGYSALRFPNFGIWVQFSAPVM